MNDMTLNERTFHDLQAYRDDLPIPKVVNGWLNYAVGHSKSLLDYGCGTGRYSAQFVGNRTVYGYDPVDSAMSVAESKGIIPWKGEKVDFIMMIEVLEHLIDPLSEMKKMYDALNPGGKIFITTPNAAWWKHRVNLLFGKVSYVEGDGYNTYTSPHIRLWTFDSVTDILKRAGFAKKSEWGTYAGFPGGSMLIKGGFASLMSAGIMVEATV